MQGLWSNHRTRLNLNNSPTPTQSDPHTVVDPPPTTEEVHPVTAVDAVPDVSPSTPSAKRKLRSNKLVEGNSNKRPKPSATSSPTIAMKYVPPTTRLSDLGGVESCVEKMLELVAMPLCHPEVYLHTGVQPPRGVLLHGPPGCGKTLLAHAIAGVCLIHLNCH